jgi:hypothetical protein
MDHFINIPVDHTGLIPDPRLADIVAEAMDAPLDFTDVFVYCHGWWTTATDSMADYSRFSVEFLRTLMALSPLVIPSSPKSSFGVGVHWPSTLSEDNHEIVNLFEPLTFYRMEKRSDEVGSQAVFALLKLMYQVRERSPKQTKLRLNLLGHSFGCRVVCSALQKLFTEITKPGTPDSFRAFVMGTRINVILLQPAFENMDLERGQSYGDLLKLPLLRMIVTRSDLDYALKNLFPLAEHINILSAKPGTRQAMGWSGPSVATINEWNAYYLALMPGYTPVQSSVLPGPGRMLVADLTQVHRASEFVASALKGHHSDIFLPEVYKVIAKFAFE